MNPTPSLTDLVALPQIRLRVMATSDVHVHLVPYDYYSDRPGQTVGLAHTARMIRAIRAEHSNTLLVDNGDFLQGNPMSDLVADQGLKGQNGIHPAIGVMNELGYDAGTLGNHEFNYGLDFLMSALDHARFPIVSANVARTLGTDPKDDQMLVLPWVILTRDVKTSEGAILPLRIGLIGFAPPQIVNWDKAHLEGRVTTRDIVEAAKAHVPALRATGADVVIALCHSGIGAVAHQMRMENAVIPLSRVPGIDAIVAGHTHMAFPGADATVDAMVDPVTGRINGVPVVMPGFHASKLGLIDLILEQGPDGWQVTGGKSEVRLVRSDTALPPDPAIMAVAGFAHEQTLEHIRKPIGQSATNLQNYFARVANTAPNRLVAEAQRLILAPAIAESEQAGLPVLSAVSATRCGGIAGADNYIDVPAGPLVLRNAAELYQYPNTPCALVLTGEDLRDWLEQSAGAFCTITPGSRDAQLLNPAMPSYNFDIIDGLTYAFDLSQPPRFDPGGTLIDPDAHRVMDLCHNGTPVAPNARFVVVTNSYRAGGGGGFEMVARAKLLLASRVSTRDAIVRMIRAEDHLAVPTTQIWRFAPMPGTTVLFLSGPGALAHMDSLGDRVIEPVGEGPDGFWTFRLHL